jgi:subtilisin family serine protease
VPKSESASSRNPFRKSSKRRPAGVSRSDKHRKLRIETLERREVMSANTVGTIVNYTADDVAMRYQMLDNDVLNSFEKVSDLTKYTQQQLASATQWVILADLGSDLADELTAGGFKVDGATGIIPGALYVSPGSGGLQAMIDALSASEDIDYFYPLIEVGKQATAVTNDPYLVNQWHLINFGQLVGGEDFGFLRGTPGEDINIEGAWDLATGAGVQIGIVDSGVQINHPDLQDNIRLDLGTNFGASGPPSDPHGTAVAGIAAGVGNNGIGITGVAYEADIVSIKLPEAGLTDSTLAQVLLYQFQQVDVYNHSWTLLDPTGNPRAIIDFGPLATTALRNSVFFGRGGLGVIHVFASGNDGEFDTTSNYSGLSNSRYTISVTGIDHSGSAIGGTFGLSTAYPEGGPDVLVAAPTGSVPLSIIRDTGLGSGIWTTDLTQGNGYNLGADANGIETDLDYFDDLDYTSRFSGTSAAAPVVSGVIALMLEANPNLTYRDVQHIMVRSARQNDPTDPSWVTNLREFQLEPLIPIDLGPFFPSSPENTWPPSLLPAPGSPTGGVILTGTDYLVGQLPKEWTNGAGFTVHQAFAGYTLSGYSHGVVDAALAVELARNWQTVGGQQSEFTWTTGNTLAGKLHAGHITNEETGERLVPGGHTGDGDDESSFNDFYDAFGDEEGFIDEEGNPVEDIPFNDRDGVAAFTGLAGIPLSPPPMTVEWIEVELNLGGDLGNINQLRISLVSPDGTVSELSAFGESRPNSPVHYDGIGTFGTTSTLGTNSFVLTTNRHWGERTESKVRVDDNGQPILDFLDRPIVDGWRLVFENYSAGEIDIQSYEVAFHGQNAENTGRVQGSIGVDDNGDGFFSGEDADNFTRYIELQALEDDPTTVYRAANPLQESWAAGVIVYVDLNQNGQREDIEPLFQTGDDGNYYFDLPEGTYDVRIDETSLPDGLNNAQNLALALSGPISTITVDLTIEEDELFPNVRYTPFEMADDESVAALNFMLVPDTPSTDTNFSVTGTVFADLNEDGILNGDDSGIGGADVYIDLNQNGIFDPTIDKYTTTLGDGSYSFIDVVAPLGFYSVVVFDGTTGSFINPTIPNDAEQGVFVGPGRDASAINFGFKGIDEEEPGGGGGGGGEIPADTPGAINGVVFLDTNNTGVREGEPGAQGIVVYIDANNDNSFNANEVSVVTGSNGAFQFNALPPSALYTIRIVTPSGFVSTGPAGGEYTEFVSPGEIATGKNFGIRSLATDDLGDLPDSFGATTGPNAARHTLGSPFYLGATVDGELDGTPSNDANGDNLIGADEDGVVFESNPASGALSNIATTWHFDVTANTTGGYLTAWADFNGNGTFEASERLTLKSALDTTGTTKKLLQSGVNELYVDVPTAAVAANGTGHVYVRFRYGEFDIDSFGGAALRGEVEDYRVPILAVNPGVQIIHGPDFNNDGKVNGRDFLIWQRGFGITTGATAAQGDADSDGDVDGDDLQLWRDEYESASNVSAVTAVDDSSDFVMPPMMDSPQVFKQYPSSTGQLSFAGPSAPSSGVVEASAQSSTFGGLNLSELIGVANAVDQLFDSAAQSSSSTEVDVDDIDAAFDAGDDSLTLPAICGEEDEIAPPFVAGEDSDSEEDAAFESAFAEVDWLLI